MTIIPPERKSPSAREAAVLKAVEDWIRRSYRRGRYAEIAQAARAAGMTNQEFTAAFTWTLRAARRSS